MVVACNCRTDYASAVCLGLVAGGAGHSRHRSFTPKTSPSFAPRNFGGSASAKIWASEIAILRANGASVCSIRILKLFAVPAF